MARIVKPKKAKGTTAKASPRSVEPEFAADLDAAELENARRDPTVKQFARYSDETLRTLRREGGDS